MYDSDNTSSQIAAGTPTIAVFGIGSVEQHSIHLPLCTDWFQVREVSRRVAQELGAFLVPALPFSMSQCHGPASGTVWLRPETLASVVREVVLSLRAQGIHKIVIVNGHGGNFVLEPLIQELNLTYPDLMIVRPPFEGGFNAVDLFEHGEVDSHAGEVETSLMLAIRPDLVKADRLDYVPTVGREFFDYAFLLKWAPDGVTGIATAGDASKGQKALETSAERVVRTAREAFSALESLKGGGLSPE